MTISRNRDGTRSAVIQGTRTSVPAATDVVPNDAEDIDAAVRSARANKTPNEVFVEIRQSIAFDMARITGELPEAKRAASAAAEAVARAATRSRACDVGIIHILVAWSVGDFGEITPVIASHRAAPDVELRKATVALENARAKVATLEIALRALASAEDQLTFIGA